MKKRQVNDNVLELCEESGTPVLSIAEEFAENTMKIKFSGKIVTETAHDFEDELMAVLSFCHHIELDMSELTYLSGMALQSLLSVQQMIDETDGAWLKITAISPEALSVMKEIGFDEIIEIVQT